MNPTAEDAYWRKSYISEPYHNSKYSYDDYAPAYKLGYENRAKYKDQSWDQSQDAMRNDWERSKGSSRLAWDDAKHASKAAWHRVDRPSM